MQFLLPLHLHDRAVALPTPPLYQKYLLPFAKAEFFEFPGGCRLSQQAEGSGYSVWQHRFFIHQPSLLYPFSPEMLLTLAYMLEGGAQCRLCGFGWVKLEQGKHYFLYAPAEASNEMMLDKGNYHCLQINFSISFLEKMAPGFPLLQSFIDKANSGAAAGDRQSASAINKDVLALLEEIIRYQESDGDKETFLLERIRQLMALYAEDQRNQPEAPLSRPKEMKILYQLIDYIHDHLDQQLSVDLLSRQAMISKSALQLIFRKRYKKSIHQTILDIRMQKAMEMLVSTDLPIGEIASLVADKSFSYFSASFAKYYGHPPRYYRKKSR